MGTNHKFNSLICCLILSGIQALAQPAADFTIDRRKICSDTDIFLTNISINANSYEWIIDNNHYSFSTDTIANLTEPCYATHQITLVAMDTVSGLTDTNSIIVEVFDTCYFHTTGTFLICPGDTVFHHASSEATDILWTINPPTVLISGCLNCDSISFVPNGFTTVNAKTWYTGGCFDIITYEYDNTCPFVGINKLTENPKIIIGPDPVVNNLYLSGLKLNYRYKIQIINAEGQICKENIIMGVNERMDVSFLNPGIYFLRLEDGDSGILIQKFIKSSN